MPPMCDIDDSIEVNEADTGRRLRLCRMIRSLFDFILLPFGASDVPMTCTFSDDRVYLGRVIAEGERCITVSLGTQFGKKD